MLKILPPQPEPVSLKQRLSALFQTSQTQLVPGTTKYWVRVMLAPICLMMVAGLHWYRVEFRNQTQWKGGGFAMFSTVDSPAARSLRCYLLTDQGEIPIEPPSRLDKWISEMRAAPARETLPIIAQRLEEATWVRGGYQWRGVESDVPVNEPTTPEPGASSAMALAIGEPPPPASEIIPINGVRLELWRYTFDRHESKLHNRLAMEFEHRLSDTEVAP